MKIFNSYWSRWMHTNENRFWMIKEDENKYAQMGKCDKK